MDNKFKPYLLAPLAEDLPDNLKTSQFQQQATFVCSGRELEMLCRISKMYAEIYADIMKEVRERYSLEIGAYDTRFSKLHRKLWDSYLNYQQLTLNFQNHD